MRATHTFAILEVSPAVYEEIREKLKAAGYQHAFMADGSIDMYGIAINTADQNEPIRFATKVT